MGQAGIADGLVEAGGDAGIGELAPAVALSLILGVELARPACRIRVEGGDLLTAPTALPSCRDWSASENRRPVPPAGTLIRPFSVLIPVYMAVAAAALSVVPNIT